MSTARHSLLGLLLVFGLPLLASAAPQPAEVSNIAARRVGSDVVVTWDAAGSGIEYYRVYWSSMSILDNAGDYDDSEETSGPETTLTLKNAPKGNVYVAVIAVDADGQESATFAEEAMATAITERSSQAPSKPAPELSVTKTIPVGDDAIRLTFDLPIALSIDALLEAVTVTNDRGGTLAVKGLSLAENELLIRTEPQSAGRYRVTVKQGSVYGLPVVDGEPLAVIKKNIQLGFISNVAAQSSSATATSSSSSSILSSASSSSVAVQSSSASSATTITPPSRTSSSSQTVALSDGPILSLDLRSFVRPDGYVDIEAEWIIAPGADIAGLAVAQSIDGGKTFSEWQPIDAALNTIRIARVPPGNFGFSLTAVDSAGTVSKPVTRTTLITAAPASPTGPKRPIGSVINNDSPLTSSGPASIMMIIVTAGALAGIRLTRKVPTSR